MNVNDIFPSRFVKASELEGREVPVKIESYTIEKMEGRNGPEQKLILKFVGKKKEMVVNKTNADRIAHLYGLDTDDWIGQDIILYAEMTNFGGKVTEGVRVKAPVKQNGKVPLEDTF